MSREKDRLARIEKEGFDRFAPRAEPQSTRPPDTE